MSVRKKWNKLFGFTIIEMLVTLAIAAILIGVSFTSYRKYQCSVYMKSALNTLTSDIKMAQQLAITNPYPDHTGRQVCYRVNIKPDVYIIEVYYDKNGNGTYGDGSNELIKQEKTVTFPSVVVATGVQIDFLQAGAPIDSNGKPVQTDTIITLTVDNMYLHQVKKITVSKTGGITSDI